MNRRFRSIITIIVPFCLLELLSLFKINILLGAKTAVFSGFSVGGPLVGLYTGLVFGAGLFGLRRIIHCLVMGTSLFSPFSLYLPTIAAGYYFKSSSWLIRLFVPLLCMILFIMHPVGQEAWFYSLYWLVPVVLYMLGSRSAFAESLGATFVQHAVGSVLWIYLVPTTSALWIALIPVVAVERLVCATLMAAVMHLIGYMSTLRLPQSLYTYIQAKI